MDTDTPPSGPIDFNNSEGIIPLLERLVPFDLTKIGKLLASKFRTRKYCSISLSQLLCRITKRNLQASELGGICYLLAKMTIWKCNYKRQ